MSRPLLAGYHVRAYEPRDASAVARLFNRVEQEPEDAESIQARFDRYPSMLVTARWVVESPDGQVVAYGNGVALHEEGSGNPHVFIVRADVDPAHERRGIGSHLFEKGETFANENGAEWIMSKARDDLDSSRKFLEGRGYRQEQHLYGVILELEGWERPLDLPQSIRIMSWSEVEDNPSQRRKLYDCTIAADADTPGIELWGLMAYDDWEQSLFGSRWYRAEGCLIAATDSDEWVGVSTLGPATGDDVSTDFTGVIREYRGRGIARALKVAGVRWAQSLGAKRLHTFNDDRNEPMRHLNFDLGFKPQTGWRMMRKDP